jgi:hypothetical protein
MMLGLSKDNWAIVRSSRPSTGPQARIDSGIFGESERCWPATVYRRWKPGIEGPGAGVGKGGTCPAGPCCLAVQAILSTYTCW